MSKEKSLEDVTRLYRDRKKDFEKSRTKRRKQGQTRPDGMKDLLKNFFEGDPETLRKVEENRALIAWHDYVGNAAALHSKALRFRGDTLIVHVTDPLWMQQLLLVKNAILKRYHHDFRSLRVKDIFFTRWDNNFER